MELRYLQSQPVAKIRLLRDRRSETLNRYRIKGNCLKAYMAKFFDSERLVWGGKRTGSVWMITWVTLPFI